MNSIQGGAESSRRGSRLPRPLTPPGKRIRTTAVPVPHYRAELRSAEFARLCALSASTVFGLPARHTVIESPPGRLLLVHIREWSTIHSWQVQPFSSWLESLIWPLLTPVRPSRHLTVLQVWLCRAYQPVNPLWVLLVAHLSISHSNQIIRIPI